MNDINNPCQAAAWVLIRLAQYEIYLHRVGRQILPRCSQEQFDQLRNKNFDEIFEYGRPLLVHVLMGAHWRVLAKNPHLSQLVEKRRQWLANFIPEPTAMHIAYLEERGDIEEQELYEQEMVEARSSAPHLVGHSSLPLQQELLGSVYFLRSGPQGAIKIGFTGGNVHARIAELQTGSAEQLLLLATMAGTMSDEQGLHRRFAALRIRGEWFHAAPELLTFILGLRGGS